MKSQYLPNAGPLSYQNGTLSRWSFWASVQKASSNKLVGISVNIIKTKEMQSYPYCSLVILIPFHFGEASTSFWWEAKLGEQRSLILHAHLWREAKSSLVRVDKLSTFMSDRSFNAHWNNHCGYSLLLNLSANAVCGRGAVRKHTQCGQMPRVH